MLVFLFLFMSLVHLCSERIDLLDAEGYLSALVILFHCLLASSATVENFAVILIIHL